MPNQCIIETYSEQNFWNIFGGKFSEKGGNLKFPERIEKFQKFQTISYSVRSLSQ